MAISNLSTGLRPGVCTSTTRPTAPYEGQVIYETDTDLVLIHNGTAFVEINSALTKAPRGIIALASATTNATCTTETVMITSSSFTAVANRYYRITYVEPETISSTANTYLQARIRKGTTISGTQIGGSISINTTYPSQFSSITCIAVTTLSAGSQQIVATANNGSGTATLGRTATAPAFILIEDIGAV